MEEAIKIVEQLAQDNSYRLHDYIDRGGEDTHYLDGKHQAFCEVLEALRGAMADTDH